MNNGNNFMNLNLPQNNDICSFTSFPKNTFPIPYNVFLNILSIRRGQILIEGENYLDKYS